MEGTEPFDEELGAIVVVGGLTRVSFRVPVLGDLPALLSALGAAPPPTPPPLPPCSGGNEVVWVGGVCGTSPPNFTI